MDWDAHAAKYVAAMEHAADIYADATAAVSTIMPGAFVTQLGGMCLVIQTTVDGGWVWVGDEHDNLPFDRDRQTGWSSYLYRGDPAVDEHENEVASATTGDRSIDGLLAMLGDLLTRDEVTAMGATAYGRGPVWIVR